MSHYYEDFSTGGVLESRGRTVTEADIVNFAGLSGDFVELHTNEEFARKSPFGRRIAHGALVFSISTGLMTQMNLINDTVLAFYGIDKLRFTGPVFIGDTVRVTKRVVELKEKDAERSEEHTSELQSLRHLVCRVLLEKNKKTHWESC